ncbi:MAG: UDP-N-acetylmuramoyl-tripeptide--D-alanyl-D-alanine ligase [Deltaproteobacteria bacterium]|nr:MAG: UDP-N-acetylmuramoyl-tripeptide--D-alanyl-D-alanine ligase [Deltaproteobacteria bacterium]
MMNNRHLTPPAWPLEAVIRATGGRESESARNDRNQSIKFSAISIDSRTLEPGSLYVAIRGKRLNGHAYIDAAVRSGAAGVMVMDDGVAASLAAQGIRVIRVPDTTRALGALGRWRRRTYNPGLVAVTGSAGKTSTREMIRCVLASTFETHVPQGNFNNAIGLPLTLLNLTPSHRWCVAELGMNGPGEIHTLTRICEPDIGVITNVGAAHVAGLGSIDGVAAAKAELMTAMEPGRPLVLNREDRRVAAMESLARGPILWFGTSDRADIRAAEISRTPEGLSFVLQTPAGEAGVRLNTFGRFMVLNALAAAGVGHIAGLSPKTIAGGLASFIPMPGRLEIWKDPSGATLMNDAYNANPVSMKGAIDVLTERDAPCRIAVLGDMKELGTLAETCHRQIGAHCAACGVTHLYVTGDYAGDVREGALAGGMTAVSVTVASKESIAAALKKQLGPHTHVLLKGSRAMEMETILTLLAHGDAEAGAVTREMETT